MKDNIPEKPEAPDPVDSVILYLWYTWRKTASLSPFEIVDELEPISGHNEDSFGQFVVASPCNNMTNSNTKKSASPEHFLGLNQNDHFVIVLPQGFLSRFFLFVVHKVGLIAPDRSERFLGWIYWSSWMFWGPILSLYSFGSSRRAIFRWKQYIHTWKSSFKQKIEPRPWHNPKSFEINSAF